ncbi:MAG: hypothetical protein VX670_11830, partial [Candidatus Latescibacterota bacterium]|nr:hypothetical protein [Candidatus Latescibacterota bacterium]
TQLLALQLLSHLLAHGSHRADSPAVQLASAQLPQLARVLRKATAARATCAERAAVGVAAGCLAQLARVEGSVEAVRAAHRRGAVVGGTSAGAAVMSAVMIRSAPEHKGVPAGARKEDAPALSPRSAKARAEHLDWQRRNEERAIAHEHAVLEYELAAIAEPRNGAAHFGLALVLQDAGAH